MRRLVTVSAGVGALCVLMSVAATASTSTWTVLPGGAAASSGYVQVTVEETGVEIYCAEATGSGVLVTGSDNVNPIAEISAGDVAFAGCQGPFGATADLTPAGTWELHTSGYDADSGISTGRIEGIDIAILGAGCDARLTGYVDVTYDNASDTVTLLPNPTVDISYVDTANNCLGLIEQGQHLRPEASFVLGPGQDISSP
jgi:hypothetical protein